MCTKFYENQLGFVEDDKNILSVFRFTVYIITLSKNDTDVALYNFDAHQPIWVILAAILVGEYAIKWWFVIQPLLTNVSALRGEIRSPESKIHCFDKPFTGVTTDLWA